MGLFDFAKQPSWYKEYKRLGIPTKMKYPKGSMYDLLKESTANYPTNIAYTYFNNLVTYRKLLENVDICAKSLLEYGITKGDIVSIIMPNTPEAITLVYALNKVGAIANMIHPLSSSNEIMDMVLESKSKIVLIVDLLWSKIENKLAKNYDGDIVIASVSNSMDKVTAFGYKFTQGRKVPKIKYDERIIPWKEFFNIGKRSDKEVDYKCIDKDAAVILHSGGTTGTPKGILLSNLNVNSVAMEETTVCGVITTRTTILAIMPIFHGFGLITSIHIPFINAATAIILPQLNPKKFASIVKKNRPSIIGGVPSLYETFINDKCLRKADLSFLDCAMCGGDYLTSALKAKVDSFFSAHNAKCKLRAAYGMTECGSGVIMMPDDTDVVDGVGIPVPDCKVMIVSPNTQVEVPTGTIGEICLQAKSVMMGYLNNPKETASMLQTHQDNKVWLHTGDLGYINDRGYVFYTQRLKRMIISNGYNIYPSQIEKVIERHKDVVSCTVVGVSHPLKVQVPKAFVVIKETTPVTLKLKNEIKKLCEENIAHYAIPASFVYKKSLPTTKMGKVDYQKLEK